MIARLNNFSIVLVLGLGLATAKVSVDDATVTEPYSLHPYSERRTLFEDKGVIHGATDCGGSSKFLRLRFEGCSTGQAPCTFVTGKVFRFEYLFASKDELNGVTIKNTVVADGETISLEHQLNDGKLTSGHDFSLHAAGFIGDGLKGIKATCKTEVFAQSDGHLITCAEASFVAE